MLIPPKLPLEDLTFEKMNEFQRIKYLMAKKQSQAQAKTSFAPSEPV